VTRSHHQVEALSAKPGVSYPDYLEEEAHLQHYIDLLPNTGINYVSFI
jgi:hypothetical protein